MRIGIDAHMVGSKETGNETYCRGLVEGLTQVNDDNDYVVYVSSEDALASFDGRSDFRRRVFRRESSAWRLTVGFARATRTDRLDVLHITYNAPLLCGCPVVVAVHDISFIHFPEFFSKRDLRLLRSYIPFSLHRAAHVLTLSESAAEDIEREYRVAREKITVTPLAARENFRVLEDRDGQTAEVCERLGVKGPYILAVGNLQPRKNLPRLIEAFGRLGRGADGVQLVLVGKAQWRESQVYEKVRRLGLEGQVVFTGYVSDSDLAALYNGSLAVVYPSLYEGFGLPILEAMACGSPVICSNVSSMPEVAGDAALLVNPRDVGEIAGAMRQIIESGSVRAELRERGLMRAASFSWANTARQIAEVYRQVGESSVRRGVVIANGRAVGKGDAC